MSCCFSKSSKSSNKKSQLHIAVLEGDMDKVRLILQNDVEALGICYYVIVTKAHFRKPCINKTQV